MYFSRSYGVLVRMQASQPPRLRAGSPPGDGPAGPSGATLSRVSPVSGRALVLFASRFGNTQRVAEALARGLRRVPGVGADCRSIHDVTLEEMGRYELLAIGGPTEILSASKEMKEFLARLSPTALRGKLGFAFDTRLAGRLSGSAGRFIEKRLERLGIDIVRPHESAIVRAMTKEEQARHGTEGAPQWVRRLEKPNEPTAEGRAEPVELLLPKAEVDFERIGAELAARLSLPAR